MEAMAEQDSEVSVFEVHVLWFRGLVFFGCRMHPLPVGLIDRFADEVHCFGSGCAFDFAVRIDELLFGFDTGNANVVALLQDDLWFHNLPKRPDTDNVAGEPVKFARWIGQHEFRVLATVYEHHSRRNFVCPAHRDEQTDDVFSWACFLDERVDRALRIALVLVNIVANPIKNSLNLFPCCAIRFEQLISLLSQVLVAEADVGSRRSELLNQFVLTLWYRKNSCVRRSVDALSRHHESLQRHDLLFGR